MIVKLFSRHTIKWRGTIQGIVSINDDIHFQSLFGVLNYLPARSLVLQYYYAILLSTRDPLRCCFTAPPPPLLLLLHCQEFFKQKRGSPATTLNVITAAAVFSPWQLCQHKAQGPVEHNGIDFSFSTLKNNSS